MKKPSRLEVAYSLFAGAALTLTAIGGAIYLTLENMGVL